MPFSAGNFRNFLDASPIPMWIYEPQTLRFVWVNAAASERYGYSPAEFSSMTVLDIRPPADAEEVVALVRSPDRAFANRARVWTHRTQDGRPLSVRVTTVDMVPAELGLRLALVEDVTSFVDMERTLTYLATHDDTTGLLNLQALAHSLDDGALGVGYHVACLRLRGLAEVGDMVGRTIEQAVAARVVEILQPAAAEGLWAFHPSNILFVALADGAALRSLLHDIRARLESPVVVDGAQWQVTPCGGMAQHDEAMSAEQVIARAAMAARTASDGGEPAAYSDALGARMRRRQLLAVALRGALREDAIDVHFQPIVPLAGAAGSPMKFEALARWTLDGVAIPPSEFIPIIESAGLAGALLRRVIVKACALIVALRQRGQAGMVMVNVPAMTSVSRQLPDDLQEICAAHGVAPACIGIEITESAVMEDSALWRKSIAMLRYLGVQLAIDDFGTGFNSLSYLDRLPADTIKLDRSFIGALFSSDRQALICASMIRLAHGLGLKVVAEGVETERQRQWLLAHQCDEAQGFLFGRPVTLAQALESLP